MRSQITGKPDNGFNTNRLGKSRNLVIQARPFLPFIFIPSEPQTPSPQERRNFKVGSSVSLIVSKAFNNIAPLILWVSNSYSCKYIGLLSSGLKRLIAKVILRDCLLIVFLLDLLTGM